MRKVFLYMYPIKEYTNMFLFYDDKSYDEMGVPRPLPVLNKAIDERYRKNGYEVYFLIYPDRELFGLEKHAEDNVVYSNIFFDESSAVDADGKEKKDFVPEYTDEKFVLAQIGDIDELVVGGYHAMDCVRKMAEVAFNYGIKSLVDIDLTDIFFAVYRQDEYFKIDSYSPDRYKDFIINRDGEKHIDFNRRLFERNYSSPVYGFSSEINKKL